MLPTLCFDLDGTIADLYGVWEWLEALQSEDAAPYYNAAERYDLDYLNDLLELYKTYGGHIVVLTWLAKGEPSEGFKRASSAAKMLWLRENLPAIEDVRTLDYGTPKWRCVQDMKSAILFDDEPLNRVQWTRQGGKAYTPSRIFRTIERLLR